MTVSASLGAKGYRVTTARLVRPLAPAQDQHPADLARGAGWLERSCALLRTYPNAGRERGWHRVFPATALYRDRLPGPLRWHHLHESSPQRAVTIAARQAGIGKRAGCHTFRHSFAPHIREAGHDIQPVQELRGHREVSTAMIYTHGLTRGPAGVRRPADRMLSP